MDLYLQRQICQRIKQARKAAGLTQEDMAGLLNVTTRAYQNYEADRVPFRRLSEIARLTSVEQEWILRGDPPTEADRGLLKDVADAVEQLERSAESVHQKLDETLARLARLEDGLSPPEERHPGPH